ncbi:exported hypothetical protein [Candidatus Zixiibacteriota bacterium]|nr:exported hypothetical protein [candidate division Zixibacteria bacterium]
MARLTKIMAIFAVLAIIVVGCQNQPNSTLSPTSSAVPNMAPKFILPAGATLDSAIFYIFVQTPTNQPVYLYRVTQDWAEMTVTWNNFGSSIAPGAYGSFMADAQTWRSVDITALAAEWFNGTYPNYGFLLKQLDEQYPRTVYRSRENVALQPYLKVCYTLDGGEVCTQELPIADAEINQLYPNDNFGSLILLYTGWNSPTSLEKQTLVKFDFEATPPPPPPDLGCTLTIGFWKNHAGFGKQANMVSPLLPIWLGTSGGPKSINVTTNLIAYNILSQNVYGTASNGITKLYAQLLGAKLNLASGASDEPIHTLIMDADAFLANYNYLDWTTLTPTQQQQVLDWQGTLDNYNNGLEGVPHCSD